MVRPEVALVNDWEERWALGFTQGPRRGSDQWGAPYDKEYVPTLVDHYRPDLLYTDGGIPFGETGRGLVAHFYNSNLKQRGRLEAVYTCKKIGSGEFVAGTCVQDMERGVLEGINPYPWQTDTSIGDWFYNRNWKFRPVSWTIHMLVDIESKNGNLLLNIVQRPDGSLDPEVEDALRELAEWTAVHGEAIYGTRPWSIYGEGAIKAKGGHFKEDFAYTARDIRFTTRKGTLYAIALGWPEDGRLLVRSLAEPAGKITKVSLLGYRGKLEWSQTAEGLSVKLPPRQVSRFTSALKISRRLVHAWATLFTHSVGKQLQMGGMEFLKEAFQKLLLNFTWWVNRKDLSGRNIFEGGFLGLDNIGVFDRSAKLPTGGYLEQADGTAWMALFSQNMLELSLEIAAQDPTYEPIALKFLEHFFWIAAAVDRVGANYADDLWDEEDGFFYDLLRMPDGSAMRLKVRSMVGLLPLCATTVISPEALTRVPWFIDSVAEWPARPAPFHGLAWIEGYARLVGEVIGEMAGNKPARAPTLAEHLGILRCLLEAADRA